MRKIHSHSCDEVFPGADYQSDEVELFKAVDRYKRQNHLKFVSIREVLEIVKSLGYRKVVEVEEEAIRGRTTSGHREQCATL